MIAMPSTYEWTEVDPSLAQPNILPASRGSWMAAELLLALYLLGWLALGIYETTRIPSDGIAEIVAAMLLVVGLAALAWRHTFLAGSLLILPRAVPSGLAS